jgi:hypothetical protein
VPPGLNERAIAAAGLAPLASEDRSDPAAEIAGCWHDARARHRAELEQQEGAEAFALAPALFRDGAGARRRPAAVAGCLCGGKPVGA